MEASGFMRVARALDATSAGALRREVLSELSKQPWWWSTPLRAMFAAENVTRASDASETRAASASSSLFQEANIRSSFRRRLLVLPVDDPAHPERNTPLGALCRRAIRAVVSAHAERCASPDGRALLSPDARLVELTAVVALPGAFAQDPHADIMDEDDDDDDDDESSWGMYPEDDSHVGTFEGTPLDGALSRTRRVRQPRLPALLTSWVSLQPVTLAGGPTVIFPGTHARGAGLARMAPKAVRAYRGSDLSEEDALFIQLMHGDAVDAANEGYAVAALDPTPAEREAGERARRERKRRERWWRRLRADTASARAEGRREENGENLGATRDKGGDEENSVDAFFSSASDAERDSEPPVSMTNEFAGDLVVMDTKVWHFGSANRSLVPRVLLNVTFQEPSARRPDVSAFSEDSERDAAVLDARRRKKRDDVLRPGGWVEDVDEDAVLSRGRREGKGSAHIRMEVRRIDGFTYHVHDSVLGKYAVRDFMPGGALY